VSGHTPGPWEYDATNIGHVYGPQVGIGCEVKGRWVTVANVPITGDDEGRGNARLIAVAPDLLAVLKKVEWRGGDCYNSGFCPSCGNLPVEAHAADCALSAAIAKAEGR
jgi:hypothetical protein